MDDLVARMRRSGAVPHDGLLADAANEIERLREQVLDAMRLSHEWMQKHDRLLAFIQARPVMLKELIAENISAAAH